MPVQLEGRLARSDRPAPGDRCPIDRAVRIVGTRSAMLLLREALYGTARFDDFVARTGLTPAVTAARLRELVDAGLLGREPYREPGQRTRQAYVLTASGHDILPAVVALATWGAKHVPRAGTPTFAHAGCGAPVGVGLRCADGHAVDEEHLVVDA
ncbi:MAG: winged helix-turn-helix transcriptional regulator [Solirubrobacteraceae bacterium]